MVSRFQGSRFQGLFYLPSSLKSGTKNTNEITVNVKRDTLKAEQLWVGPGYQQVTSNFIQYLKISPQ